MLPCATLPTRPRCPPKEPIVSASRSYSLPVTRPGPRTRGPRAGRALIRLRGIDGRLYAIVLLRWAHEAMRARARAPTARRPRSIDVPPMCAIRTPGRRLIRQGRRFPSGRGARALARSLAPASCIRRPEPSPGNTSSRSTLLQSLKRPSRSASRASGVAPPSATGREARLTSALRAEHPRSRTQRTCSSHRKSMTVAAPDAKPCCSPAGGAALGRPLAADPIVLCSTASSGGRRWRRSSVMAVRGRCR